MFQFCAWRAARKETGNAVDRFLAGRKREGSSHYRPEAAKAPQTAAETEEKSAKPEKPKKREISANEKEAKPPKKPKQTKPEKEPKETPAAEGEGEEEAEGGPPLPW